MNHYKTICEIVDGDISAKVLFHLEEMIKEGERIGNSPEYCGENPDD